jgi:4-hydroxy-tetrahydrodipicolinate synthase
MNTRIGLNCALSTPFLEDDRIDLSRMVAHARWVLDQGVDGLTLFGTTGEGASIDITERYQALGALAGAGIELRRHVVAGVSAATIEQTVEQARAGYAAGCRAVMIAPPFYFAQASDEGLFRFFSSVFDRLGGSLRDVILYHIPGMTRNEISISLTKRLVAAYPGAILGIKDSNGQWGETEARLREFPQLQILVGDERQLARAVRQGGSGSICGLANVAPDLLLPLVHEAREEPRVNAMVDAILGYSFMSAVKAMIGERVGDPGWRRMRAPLDAFTDQQTRELSNRLNAIRSQGSKAA